MKEKDKDWIQTFSGLKFYPMIPSGEIRIEDIAHALSMQCRYGGHSERHYSVAQHSVLVSYEVPSEMALSGLLHDASEAYLVDLPRPVKHSSFLAGYREVEEKVERMIAEHFGVPHPHPQEVMDADLLVYASEARALFPKIHPDWNIPRFNTVVVIEEMTPKQAENLFLSRFSYLTRR